MKRYAPAVLIGSVLALLVLAVVVGRWADQFTPRPPAVHLTLCELKTETEFRLCAYAAKHHERVYQDRCDRAIAEAELVCGPSGPEEPPVPGFPLGDSK